MNINPTKRAKSKNSNYSPIPQGCMNNHSGRAKFIIFRILLDSGSSSTIVMVKLMSKLKKKSTEKNYVVNPSREFHDLNKGYQRLLSVII